MLPPPVLFALACALLCSVASTPAATAPTGIDVAGEPCPGARLEDRVRQFVSAEQQARAGVVVEAHLRRLDDGQWQLDLVIDREGAADPSARKLVAPHCETVVDAAAFVIAVAVDPTLAAGTAPREAPVEPAPVEPTIPAPTTDERRAAPESTPPSTTREETRRVAPPAEPEPPPDDAPPPGRKGMHGILRAGGGLDGGALPRVGALFEGAIGVGGRWFRAELTGIYRLQTIERSDTDPTVGGRFSMWAFGGRGCGVPRRGRVEFPVCAGLEGGRMVAQGYGLTMARTERLPWGAATLGPGVAFKPHKNIALVLQAAIGFPFVRSRLTIENLGTIHRTGPVFGRLWLGFEGRFP